MRQTNTLSVHCPLTSETKGMIGYDQLSLLPQGAVIVNDARGPIVDPDAIYKLLKSGHLAGAGLDVKLPVEPPVEPIPRIAARLPRQGGLARRPARHHAAFGLADAAFVDGYAAQIGRDNACRIVDQHNPQNVITPDMF